MIPHFNVWFTVAIGIMYACAAWCAYTGPWRWFWRAVLVIAVVGWLNAVLPVLWGAGV